MNGKFVASIALGAIAGYAVSKMQEKGYMNEMRDKWSEFTAKTKRNVKNAVDKGANEIEYAKDRVKDKAMKLNEQMG